MGQSETSVEILVSDTQIAMGESITVRAELLNADAGDYLALPFVNNSRWGAHERFNKKGIANFQIPLPNPGYQQQKYPACRISHAG